MLKLRAFPVMVVFVILAAVAAPSAEAATIVGVTGAVPPTVVTFDSAAPGTFLTSVPLSGLAAGEQVVGLDFDPREGVIFAITRDAAGTGRLYHLDAYTGVFSAPLVLAPDPVDPSPSPYAGLPDTHVEIDVNPFVDRIRLANGSRNLRVNPLTGLVLADTDFSLATNMSSVAYTNNIPTASTTALYGYNLTNQSLDFINPPNSGSHVAVGNSGFTAVGADAQGMDVSTFNNDFFATATVGGTNQLYSMSVGTGAGTLIGALQGNIPVGDFTVRPNVVSLTTPTAVASEGTGGSAVLHLHRADPFSATRIDWTATPGTATAGDFTASGSATFAAGVTDLDVVIPVTDDTIDEHAETFTVTLAASLDVATLDGAGQLTAQRTATVTLGDNDVTPDTTKPFLFVLQPALVKLAALRKLGLLTVFTTSEAVTGTAQLRLGTKLVGSVSFSSTKASLVTKRVKLSKVGAALVAKAKGHRVKLVLSVTAKDGAGNAATKVSRVVYVTK